MRTFGTSTSEVIPIPEIASVAFQPIPVVGPISFWTRLGGGYVTPYRSLNLITGATEELSWLSANMYTTIDATMGQGILVGLHLKSSKKN